ncbi:unnamed protein product [Staurois parvus]|uniref:Uncharacterized protein n=1 Tax=Staurois parvus TaxID=386267 RepID=A0ABN9CFD3_9NEOB|nr:unnamed protein product [Staurois parvus]
MGPPTDPGPSGSARVLQWSVRPCCRYQVWGRNKFIPKG